MQAIVWFKSICSRNIGWYCVWFLLCCDSGGELMDLKDDLNEKKQPILILKLIQSIMKENELKQKINRLNARAQANQG